VVKGNVKIAYWDTEQSGRPPRALGDYSGTPTIRLFKPVIKQGDSEKKKIVKDYKYERKAVDMKRFVDAEMPNFLERVKGLESLKKFEDKADRNGLPRVLVFTSKDSTPPMLKYLSTKFRRRAIIAAIHPNDKNTAVAQEFGVTERPAVVVIPGSAEGESGGEAIHYEGEFTKHRIERFVSEHALKEKVFPKKKEKEPEKPTETEPKKPTKTESEKPTETEPKTEL